MGAPRGNQNAFKAKLWSAAINRALNRRQTKKQGIEALDELADLFLDGCYDGSLQYLQELGNRLEGKPHQSMEISGNLLLNAEHLTDDELAHIAAGGSAGTDQETDSQEESSPVH